MSTCHGRYVGAVFSFAQSLVRVNVTPGAIVRGSVIWFKAKRPGAQEALPRRVAVRGVVTVPVAEVPVAVADV